MRFLSQAL